MKKLCKLLKKLFGILALLYGGLFVIFFFDLDGKILYHVVEPFLSRHYDKMERKDPLKQVYDVNKPSYEYDE